jgi:hypothetical protein
MTVIMKVLGVYMTASLHDHEAGEHAIPPSGSPPKVHVSADISALQAWAHTPEPRGEEYARTLE